MGSGAANVATPPAPAPAVGKQDDSWTTLTYNRGYGEGGRGGGWFSVFG